MIPYFTFFLFFGLSSIFDHLKTDELLVSVRRKTLWLGFFLIIFFVGFRYKIGSDWLTYMDIYVDTNPISKLLVGDGLGFSYDYIEPGFKILIGVCRWMNMSFPVFTFVIAVFNTISAFCFLRANKIKNKFTLLALILILTTFLEFDILRQSVAMHIVLFAFRNEKLKFYKVLLLTVLAMTFHNSAFIFFVYFIFQKLKPTKTKIAIITVFYFISLFITLPVITTILDIVSPLLGSSLSAVLYKAQSLVSTSGFARTISFTSLLNLGFLVLLYLNISKLTLTQSEHNLLMMFLFYILLLTAFKEIQDVADRFSYYFNFGIAYMFCLLSDFVRLKERKVLVMLVPSLFILMRLTLHFMQEPIRLGQTPYRNYFFVEPSDEPAIKVRYDKMQSLKKQQNESQQN